MLTAASGLTDRDLDAIAALEQRVVSVDGGRLKLEWGVLRHRDGSRVDDLLWWDGGQLLGFCGCYGFGGQIELAGMVDPAVRRRGVGTALLREALSLAAERGAMHVLLVTPRTTEAGREFARHHGARLDHSEHHLVLGPTPTASLEHDDVCVRDAVVGDAEQVHGLLVAAFGSVPADMNVLLSRDGERQLVVERGGEVIGCLRLSAASETSTGIYGFAVKAELRGRGIGRAVLSAVCRELRERGPHEVTLEVAVDNDHALGLYTGVGFEQRATEDYYAVPTAAIL